jgi:hypothetical protein
MGKEAKLLVLLFAFILVFSFTIGSATAEAKESPFKRLVTKAFPFLAKTTGKSVNAVGGGVKKSADVVTQEVKDVGAVATGKGSKVKDVLVNPVTGTADAVGGTVHGVVTAPIDAAKEVNGTK